MLLVLPLLGAAASAGGADVRPTAPATGSTTTAQVQDAVRFRRSAAPAPARRAARTGDWAYLMDGGSRWDPCGGPIGWSYNRTGQRYAARADVAKAFAKISVWSGLKFTYVGRTSYVYRGRLAHFPRRADIAVGWANAAQLKSLAGGVVGIGGATARQVTDENVKWKLVKGYLTLDKGAASYVGRGFKHSGWGQIMMHEILHSLGLGHAKHADQLMYPVASSRNYRFGAGDRTGMRRIGRSAGCLS